MLYKNFFLTFLFFFITYISDNLNAQSPKALDSMMTDISIMVYNDPKAAIQKANDLYPKLGDDAIRQVSLLLTIANSYVVLKDHEKVFETAEKARKIAEKDKNYVNQIRILGFISGQYQRINLKDKALSFAEQAYQLSIDHPLPDTLKYLQANIVFVKGLIQKDNLGCEYALTYFNEAAAIYKKAKGRVKLTNASLAIIYNNIGDCQIEKGDLNAANVSFDSAIKYAELAQAKKSIACGNLGMGKVLLKENHYKESVEKLGLALQLSTEAQDKSVVNEVYKTLAAAYLKMEDEKNYTKYTALYLAQEKQLIDREKKSINNVVGSQNDQINQSSNAGKNNFFYGVLTFCIIIILIFLVLLLKVLQKKRQLEKLKKSTTLHQNDIDNQ